WRCFVRSSAASCWARFDASAMSTRSATGAGRAKPPGGAVLSGPAALHAEQVAQLQEEPVRGATQVAEPEGVGLGERCAVTQEDDRARRRLIGEQQVVAEVVRDDRSRDRKSTRLNSSH